LANERDQRRIAKTIIILWALGHDRGVTSVFGQDGLSTSISFKSKPSCILILLMELILLRLIFRFGHALGQFFDDLWINLFMRYSSRTKMATLMRRMIWPTLVAKMVMAAGTKGYIWSSVVAEVARDVVGHDERDEESRCVSEVMWKWWNEREVKWEGNYGLGSGWRGGDVQIFELLRLKSQVRTGGEDLPFDVLCSRCKVALIELSVMTENPTG
jgi:hypothetical protein